MHVERLGIDLTIDCGKPLRRRMVAIAQGRSFESTFVRIHAIAIIVVVVSPDTRRRTGAISLAGNQQALGFPSGEETEQHNNR